MNQVMEGEQSKMDSYRVSSFKTPEVMSGCGARKRLPELVRSFGRRVCVVIDPGIAEQPIIQECLLSLTDAGMAVGTFTGIPPDPSIEVVDKCVKAGRGIDAEVMVAIGGGSSLDIAKCAAIMLQHECGIESLFDPSAIPGRGIPTILAPTTAGTGSEVTPIAVLSDETKNLKRGVVSDDLLADVALVDPEFCVTLPPVPTAYTGMDALTHAIEAYTNRFAVPLIDCMALEAIRLVARNLCRCVENGTDIDARYGMSIASLLGGFCLRSVNTAAVHALAYPLGGAFHVAHGIANSLLLPHVMRFNADAVGDRYERIAELFGEDDAVEAVENLSRNIGANRKMREFGIHRDDLPAMAKSAMEVQRLLKNNPRDLGQADALSIYASAW